jgi:hypothetical protein
MHTPFVFSSIQPYPPVALAVFFYLEFAWGCALTHSLVELPHFSCHWKPSPQHTGGGGATPTFSGWLFIYSLLGGVSLPPIPVELSTGQLLLQAFPGAQGTLPSLICVFFFQLLVYFQFIFFLFFP